MILFNLEQRASVEVKSKRGRTRPDPLVLRQEIKVKGGKKATQP
jgi:hypothetical protein